MKIRDNRAGNRFETDVDQVEGSKNPRFWVGLYDSISPELIGGMDHEAGWFL